MTTKKQKSRKGTYEKRKKSAQKKSVGKTLRNSKGTKKASPKPRSAKKVKSTARKATPRVRRTQTARPRTRKVTYSKKSIRTSKRFLNGKASRKFTIRKRSEKFIPAIKPDRKAFKKISKKVDSYRKKSKAKVWLKLKVKDKITGQERWVSTKRTQLKSKVITDIALDSLFDILDTGVYGKDLSIKNLEIEVNA